VQAKNLALGIVENHTEELKIDNRGKKSGEVLEHSVQVCLRGYNVRGLP
jgi:hypothetical protein